MQQFNIVQNATLPYLEMEVINNGRDNYDKIYVALQAAQVSFTMINNDTKLKKILNAPCDVVPVEDNGCIEKYKIRYKWNKKDTSVKGQYKGAFKLTFTDNIVMEGFSFPKGELIVPIAEELIINIL